MNLTQKETIIKMRQRGMNYVTISEETGIPINTVKSICYRKGVQKETKEKDNTSLCKHCGKEITEKSISRPRLFCSNACKQAWWNKRRYERTSSKVISHTCATCGKSFTDYIGAERKYCSQACYRKRSNSNGE